MEPKDPKPRIVGVRRLWTIPLVFLGITASVLTLCMFVCRLPPDLALQAPEHGHSQVVDPSASCGPVSLSVVARWLGAPIPMAEFNRLTGADPLGVCSMLDLKRALTAKGFQVTAILVDLQRELSVTDPLVIYKRSGHFCVAVPVDEDRLIIIDPPADPEVAHRQSLVEVWRGEALAVRSEVGRFEKSK